MKADRQIASDLVAATGDHRHHAGGRQGYLAPRKRHAFVVEYDFQRLGDVVEIEQRLALAHHHDVGKQALFGRLRPFVVGIAGQHDLTQDLRRRQVAFECLGAGMAELATQHAADLAGNAQGAPVFFGDEDTFGLAAVIEADQPFAGPVLGNQVAHHAGAPYDEAVGHARLQRLGKRGHAAEVGFALVVQPQPHLLGAKRLLADGREGVDEFVPGQADQIERRLIHDRIHRRSDGESQMEIHGDTRCARGLKPVAFAVASTEGAVESGGMPPVLGRGHKSATNL